MKYVFYYYYHYYRFRSIAKSYFRKADGVLLLYDVTCETSFINVRDWVEAIEVNIPQLVIAHKWLRRLS